MGITRKEFDRETKRNHGKPYTLWEYAAWVSYRETRLRPHPGTTYVTVPPRGMTADPYGPGFARKFLRNTHAMGLAAGRALNRIFEERLIQSGPLLNPVRVTTPDELEERFGVRASSWPYGFKGTLADWQRWCEEREDWRVLREVEQAAAMLGFGPFAQLECQKGGEGTGSFHLFGGDLHDLGTAIAQARAQVRNEEPLDYGDD